MAARRRQTLDGVLPRRTLPVLMYHRIGTAVRGDPRLWLSPSRFADQLRWLSEAGYRTLSLDQAFQCWRSGQTPRRAVLLTFDDAFAETVQEVSDTLQRAAMQATMFVPAALLGRRVSLRHPVSGVDSESEGEIVTAQGLRAWVAEGFDVGSHSLTHRDLRGLDEASLQLEITASRQRLEEILSRPVRDFCFPFAHHDEIARREVAAAGYRTAYAGEPPVDDLFAIPRMMVLPRDTRARFRRKISGYYYWLSAWHRRLRPFMRH